MGITGFEIGVSNGWVNFLPNPGGNRSEGDRFGNDRCSRGRKGGGGNNKEWNRGFRIFLQYLDG